MNHVLYIPRWYPSDSDPMLGLFVKNHAKAAAKAGYRISVAYASPSKEKLNNRCRVSLITEDQVTEAIVYYSSASKIRFLLQFIAWFKAIRLAIKHNGKPGLIHAHILTRTGVFAWLLSVRYGIRYIITEHWSRYYAENLNYKGWLRKLLTKFVIWNASQVSVVSKRLYNAMKKNGLKFEFNLLPNVVDTDLFNIAEHNNTLFRFISITCFEDKSKNIRMLIDAASELKKKNLQFELILAGDGHDRQMIEDHAQKQGLSVSYTGMLPQAETAYLLKQCDCLVLSSNYETFGIVVFEALASGVPVISTDVADLNELIDPETGILIPVGDRKALENAMEDMIKKPDFTKEWLRRKVIDKCSVASVSAVLDSMYQQFIK